MQMHGNFMCINILILIFQFFYLFKKKLGGGAQIIFYSMQVITILNGCEHANWTQSQIY